MRYAVLGTGSVGQALAARLVELGHEVRMGSRSANNPRALEWVSSTGERASAGTFEGAAAFGEVLINATHGGASLDALRSATEANLRGKVLIDVANLIERSADGSPRIGLALDDSLAEQIQRAFPEVRVVKALNTVNKAVMVDPEALGDDHLVFLCGNDGAAKEQVRGLLREMGWGDAGIIDMGGVEQARGPELYVALWIRLLGPAGGPLFNIRLARPDHAA